MSKQNGNGTAPEEKKEEYWQTVRRALTGSMYLGLIERAIPKGVQLDPLALVWQAVNVIETPNEKGECPLLMCDLQGIRRAVLKAATLGLQFQGECYLIAYGGTCNFQTSIWGEIHIVERTGRLKNVWADVIYESDPYKIVRGLKPDLFHDITDTWGRPGANIPIGETKGVVSVESGGRGRPLGSYACAELDDGVVRWAVMSEAEMAIARGNASSRNSPSHRDWPDEMRKKMAFRRAQKTWPHTPLLATALAIEGDVALDEKTEADLRSTAITTDGKPVQAVAQLEAPKQTMGDTLLKELKNRKKGTEQQELVPNERKSDPPPPPAQQQREPGED